MHGEAASSSVASGSSPGQPAPRPPGAALRTGWWLVLAAGVIIVAIIAAVMLLRWLLPERADGGDDGDSPRIVSPSSDLPPNTERLELNKTSVKSLNVSGQEFSSVVMAGSVIQDSDFDGTVMRGANFRESHLSICSFVSANLVEADFTDAVIQDCVFQGAVLIGADLSGATIEGTSFRDATYDRTTRFPVDFGDPAERGLTCTDCQESSPDDPTTATSTTTEAGTAPTSDDSTSTSTGDQPGPSDSGKSPTIKMGSTPRCSSQTHRAILKAVQSKRQRGTGEVRVSVLPDGRVHIADRELAKRVGPLRLRSYDRRECTVILDLR